MGRVEKRTGPEEEPIVRRIKIEMLACPFCGCDDLETSPFPGNREHTSWICRCGNPGCHAEIEAPTWEEAARRWNRSVFPRGPAYEYDI